MKTLINLFKSFVLSEGSFKYKEGYHSANRARVSVIYRDNKGNPYKINLPKNDPGGEHD